MRLNTEFDESCQLDSHDDSGRWESNGSSCVPNPLTGMSSRKVVA
jgi:hypothetical protein